jgi:hypothetical protein
MEEREQNGQTAISKENLPENPVQKKNTAPPNEALEREASHPQYDSFMRVIRR